MKNKLPSMKLKEFKAFLETNNFELISEKKHSKYRHISGHTINIPRGGNGRSVDRAYLKDAQKIIEGTM